MPEPGATATRILANGGRVLNVTALGAAVAEARRPRLCGDRANRLAGAGFAAAISAGAPSSGRNSDERTCPSFSQASKAAGSPRAARRFSPASAASGPLLFLLHGYPQTHVIWHRVAPLLAGQIPPRHLDLRGYGASSMPPTDAEHFSYSKRSMALDMIDIADQLGAAKLLPLRA